MSGDGDFEWGEVEEDVRRQLAVWGAEQAAEALEYRAAMFDAGVVAAERARSELGSGAGANPDILKWHEMKGRAEALTEAAAGLREAARRRRRTAGET